jgi:hypothetical protein
MQRVERLTAQVTAAAEKKDNKETVTVVDNRNGKSYTLPITHRTVKASDLNKIGIR